MDSVKERIERQIVADLAAGLNTAFGLEAANVQRFDHQGNHAAEQAGGELPPALVVVTAGEADGEPADETAIGEEQFTLPITIDAHLLGVPDGVTIAEHGNKWLAELHRLAMANPQWTETATGEALAIDTRVAAYWSPQAESEGRDFLVGLEVHINYRHAEGDPTSLV